MGLQCILSVFPSIIRFEQARVGLKLVAVVLVGVNVPAGMSAYKYLGMACGQRTPECQKIIAAVQADTASAARADAAGRVTMPGVPAGTYYLMISTRYNNQALVWDQAVELQAGSNSMSLDVGNGKVVN